MVLSTKIKICRWKISRKFKKFDWQEDVCVFLLVFLFFFLRVQCPRHPTHFTSSWALFYPPPLPFKTNNVLHILLIHPSCGCCCLPHHPPTHLKPTMPLTSYIFPIFPVFLPHPSHIQPSLSLFKTNYAPDTLHISPLPGHCCRQCHPQRSRSGQLLWHHGWSSHGLPPPPFHPPPSPPLPGGCSKRTVTSQC